MAFSNQAYILEPSVAFAATVFWFAAAVMSFIGHRAYRTENSEGSISRPCSHEATMGSGEGSITQTPPLSCSAASCGLSDLNHSTVTIPSCHKYDIEQ